MAKPRADEAPQGGLRRSPSVGTGAHLVVLLANQGFHPRNALLDDLIDSL
jgi:hypothetical protein